MHATALIAAMVLLATTAGCSSGATAARHPTSSAYPDDCQASRASNETGSLSGDPVLPQYLDAAKCGDCASAERFVHHPVTGDFCVDGSRMGPQRFTAWRNAFGMPTPSCCIAYSVQIWVIQNPGDTGLPRWETRTVGLEHFPQGFRIIGVGSMSGR